MNDFRLKYRWTKRAIALGASVNPSEDTSAVTNIRFEYNMPSLQFLILSVSDINSLRPHEISHSWELIYKTRILLLLTAGFIKSL